MGVDSMKDIAKILGIISIPLLLISCFPPAPKPETERNICDIFKQYPAWYWEAKATEQKWGIPVAVQMAIMYEESGFQATAEPFARVRGKTGQRWVRESSALGYCQALNDTWACYEKNTGQDQSRDEFADASDFIGWYSQQVQQQLKISPNDAYDLYLAYHEGTGGYRSHSYWRKPWLIHIAHEVQARAQTYAEQLKECEDMIPRPTVVSQHSR